MRWRRCVRPLGALAFVSLVVFALRGRVGVRPRAVRVRGAVQRQDGDEENAVFLRGDVSRAQLEHAFADQVVSIWQYGVGDRVEMALIEQ